MKSGKKRVGECKIIIPHLSCSLRNRRGLEMMQRGKNCDDSGPECGFFDFVARASFEKHFTLCQSLIFPLYNIEIGCTID